jgi:thiamine transport system ATP-binding protein
MTLDTQHLTVSYLRDKSHTALAIDDVSLSLDAGQVLAILGPSGSGKSTLLRAIAGLEVLDAGRVLWDGADITAMPVHKRGFALMFQDGQLFAHRTVASNVAYALQIARMPVPQQRDRVAELLALVGLEGFGDRRVTELSGGEQQRVALARSLAARPRLLLLDEPLSSLDRELRERLGHDLRRILVDTGTTAIFVTHDQGEAVLVADRIGIMMDSHLVQLGDAPRVLDEPATPAVERFLGARG